MIERSDSKNETSVEVKVFRIDLRCTECETGRMRPTGETYLTNPPQHVHKCNNKECGSKIRVRGKCYPIIEYKEI